MSDITDAAITLLKACRAEHGRRPYRIRINPLGETEVNVQVFFREDRYPQVDHALIPSGRKKES